MAMAGCAHAPRVPPAVGPLVVVPDDRWPDLVDDLDASSLAGACSASITYFDGIPSGRVFRFGTLERSAGELAAGVRRGCELAAAPPDTRRKMLQREFMLLRSVGRDGSGEVLFTGYYEPLIDARRDPDEVFRYPVRGVPDDLVTVDLDAFGVVADRDRIVGRVEDRRLLPYPDRAAIDFGNGLVDPGPVLGWVDDPVSLFFLHVQGSGTLVFDDGSMLRAGYAATNGRPYRSIGRLLIDDGLVSREAMSMQAIRGYLEDHPEEIERVLSFNPSYVFFRPLPAAGGPLGCYEVPVTGGRSIATDRRLFPAPVLAWITTAAPTRDGGERRLSRFVLNQDTGGSIRGPGRVDLFFGRGDEAGQLAGRTKHTGELYLLIPKRDQGGGLPRKPQW